MAGRRSQLAGRLRKLCVALAAGLCLMTTTSVAPAEVDGSHGPKAGVAATAPLDGINIVGLYAGVPLTRADNEIAAARTLHVAVVRTEIPWSVMEPSGPGRLDPNALAFTDRLFADAAASRIKVIAFVDSTPCWASSAPTSLLRRCRPGVVNKANAWPPTEPATYATFVAYLAQRYNTRLAALEVWNEPDQINEQYFAGPEKARRYASILRAAYPAIKRADPGLPVLAGSLVGYNGVFLRALYAAGIKGYYDGLSVHYYSLLLASLRAIHATQLAAGDIKPLWLDEFGWSSCWPKKQLEEDQACVTKQVQATNITNTFRLLARAPYIATAVMYDLQESATEQFGVLASNGTRKPAFTALARVLVAPFASPSPIVLNLRRRGGEMVASGSAPVGDYMQLEAFQGSTLRYKVLFTLNRFNRYALTLPAALGTSGLTVRVYQAWTGPGRAAQKSI